MPVIKGFETDALRELRVKYAVSNKDLFSRLGRPIDKVFSAKGGSTYYNMSDNLNRMALQLCLDVRDGYSARTWVEHYWKPHFLDDPCGMLYMEVGEGKVYPTYKSIASVYDYQPKGVHLDYVVFYVAEADKLQAGLKPEDKIYRVCDDAYDYYVKMEGEKMSILQEHTFPNYFGKVPGIINSDITDPQWEGSYKSVYDDIIEIAEQYLLKGSVKITHDFLHGFPKYWEYADACGECQGDGLVNGSKCTSCKGTGKALMVSPSQAKILTPPASNDDPVYTPNVAGYVEPSKIYHEIAIADRNELQDVMEYTLWGHVARQNTSGARMNAEGKTATEAISEMQATIDRLHPISESAEKRIKFVTDHVVKLHLRKDYEGASINLGRRYVLETADETWRRYVDAKTAWAPQTLLDELLNEYVENKYSGDPIGLAIAQKLMLVEPFVHKSAEEVQKLGANAEDYAAKLYYGEWLATTSDADLLKMPLATLKKSLYKYAAQKSMSGTNTNEEII